MSIFNRKNPWSPVFLGFCLFIIIGYVLYLLALLLPEPLWVLELIEYSKPSISALRYAAAVAAIKNQNPFPIQIVILYCAVGSLVLVGWCSYWINFHRPLYEESLDSYKKKPPNARLSTTKLILTGLFSPFVSSFCIYVAFWFSKDTLTWRDMLMYSSNIGSVTFLLIVGLLASLLFSTAIFAVRIAIATQKIQRS